MDYSFSNKCAKNCYTQCQRRSYMFGDMVYHAAIFTLVLAHTDTHRLLC